MGVNVGHGLSSSERDGRVVGERDGGAHGAGCEALVGACVVYEGAGNVLVVVLVENAHRHQLIDHALKSVGQVYGVVEGAGAFVDADVDVGFPDGVAVFGGFSCEFAHPVFDFVSEPDGCGSVAADRVFHRDCHGELLPHANAARSAASLRALISTYSSTESMPM